MENGGFGRLFLLPVEAGNAMFELLGLVCLTLAWLVPNHYPPWNSFYNESCAALGLFFLVLALGRDWLGRSSPALMWGVAAVVLVPVLQWTTGQLAFSGDAVVAALYLLGFATAVGTGHAWAARFTDCRCVAVYRPDFRKLAVEPPGADDGAQYRRTGPVRAGFVVRYAPARDLGQPNNLATLIGMGVLGIMLLYEQRRLGAVAATATLGVLLVGAALTQSRTALLFGPAVLVGYLFFRRREVALNIRPAVIGIAVAAQWVLAWSWPWLQGVLLLNSTESLAQRSAGSVRFQVWPILFDALSQVPWRGFGWLQVGAAELASADRYPPVGEMWMHGHNLFFELVIWCGYPVGILLSAGIVWWYASRLHRLRSKEAAIGMLLVSIFGLHAMLELPYHYAYFLIPVGLWIGQVEFDAKAGLLPASWLGLAPPAVAFLLMLAVWRDYPAVEEDYRLMRFEHLRIGSLRATEPAPNAPFLSSLTAFLRFTPHGARAGNVARRARLHESGGITLSLCAGIDALRVRSRAQRTPVGSARCLREDPAHSRGGVVPVAQARLARPDPGGAGGLIPLEESLAAP